MDSGLSLTVTRRTLLGSAVAGGLLSTMPAASAIPTNYDSVYYWTDYLLRAIRAVGGPPTVHSRNAAMMYLSMYDATNSGSVAYLARPPRDPKTTYLLRTCLDDAAVTILKHAYPNAGIDFDAARANAPRSSFQVEPGPNGFGSTGVVAAQNMISARAADGSTNSTAYTISTAPGQWRPTEAGTTPTSPNWGAVLPFVMTSSSQYRPQLPGGFSNASTMLASQAYVDQFKEVRDLGSRTSTARSSAQTASAFFWAVDLDGTYKPPGQLLTHTKTISSARQAGLSGDETTGPNVVLFARVAAAMADAAIAAWDSKYRTSIDLWRPQTAIRLADQDGNAATAPIASWSPLSQDRSGVSFSPSFPAYVSGHATFAGAWAETLRLHYGTDAYSFTVGTEDPNATVTSQSFSSFSAAARANADSRIYLGVHYRWDADQGLAVGKQVGAAAIGRVR